MYLFSCPNELLLLIAKELIPSQRDINALVQTCRLLFQLLNPFLYRSNTLYHEASALAWAVTEGIEATTQRSLQSGAPLQMKSSYTGQLAERRGPRPRRGRMRGRILASSEDDLFYPERHEHPISRSARLGHLDIVQILHEYGVDLNYQNAAGSTPLSLAAEGGHLNLVHFLVTNGASPLVKDFWGDFPLSCAVSKGHEEVFKVLLDQLERCHSSEAKVKLQRALTTAVQDGQDQMAKALLARGVSANHCTGCSPLTIAVNQGWPDMVKLLLENGANPNIVNSKGDGAFSTAAKNGKLLLLQLLLPGVDIDCCGCAALFWAVFNKRQDIVQYLIDHNAPLSYLRQLDRQTTSIVDCAFHTEDQAILQLLQKNGAGEVSDHAKAQRDQAFNTWVNEVRLSCIR